jgi:adhesin/invasin
VVRALRIGAGFALAFVVLTCTDGQVAGPKASGALRLDLSALTGPAASGEPDIPLDSIRVTFRPAGQSAIAYDTTIAPVGSQVQGDSAVLQLSVPLSQSPEDFDVDVQAFGGGVLWYQLVTTLTISSGSNPTPPPFTATYVGPGSHAASVRVLPADTTAEGGTAFALHSVVYDSSNAPISGVPVGYRLSDSTYGSLTVSYLTATLTGATNVRDSVWLIAETPTHITDSTRVHIEPPAATLQKVSGDLQNGPVGVAFSLPLSVLVLDALGAPYRKGKVVTWSVTAGAANLSTGTTTTDTAGNAAVTLTPTAAGGVTVQASVANLTPVTFTATANGLQPASITKISGDNQTGAGGGALAQPLVVEVRDASANPVPNATVSWATSDGGSLTPTSGPTGIDGRAQATWTLGSSVPNQTATATVGALAPVVFSATATISTPALNLSFAGVPGVGVGLSAKVYVDLNQAAPAGSTLVTLASGDVNTFTVAPGTVTIPQGMTRDSVVISGVAPGQANLTATATGYATGTLPVVVQNRNISVPQSLNVPYGQTASLPIQLPAPAPAGGVTFTVLSSAPGYVGVATPSVTIAAGSQTANATLNGVLPGPATITVTNPAYFDGVTAATTTASLNIVQSSSLLNASFGSAITIDFESNGAAAAAPAPGISVSLTPSDPNCVAVTSPVSIPTGLVSTTATLTYGGTATLPCTTKILAQATNLQPDSINVTVNPMPGITVGSLTVGSGLQDNTSFTLGAPNHGNINVTVTSSDAGVLLAPNATTAGTSQITLPVADGVQTVGFYVQALEGRTTDSIVATVTVSATGFSDGTGTMTAVQGALDLQGLPGSTTTLSASNALYARVGTPNAANTGLTQVQNVRAGAPGALTATFTTPAGVGELLKAATAPGPTQMATIPIGLYYTPFDTTSGGVAFHPVLSGSTTVSATIPGFIATTVATRSVTVTQPGITVGSLTVGSGLQDNTSFTLGAPNHGNINVTLTSSDAGVLLAPNATTAGTSQITLPVADGVQTVGFYVQALEGRTTDTIVATVTVTATGFSDGTGTMTAVQGALDLQGLPGSTTTLSASNVVYVRVGTSNAANTGLTQVQNVRAGAPGALTATFTTPAGVGELLKAATAPGPTQTATIPIGLYYTPFDTTSGGVAFHPVLSGSTTVNATISGFIATTVATRSITVSQPGITVGSLTVGSGLQDNTSFTLGAPNHGNINVTVTSSDAGVLLAPNATTAGTSQITLPVADGVQTVGFYVQALEGRMTDTIVATVTVSATGFSDGTGTMTAVQGALDLQGLPGTTTTLSPSNALYVRVGTPNATNTGLTQVQNVRAGAPGPLTVTFTTPPTGVGEILKQATPPGLTQTATIPIGLYYTPFDTTSGGVAFHPLLSGSTTVNATIPGFIATTVATRSVTVTQPGITVGSLTVGSGLQDYTSFTLGAPNHGNISVTVASSNAAVVLVSPNATTAGTSQITLPVADVVQTVSFYVQAPEGQTGSATATITVSAPGFTNGTNTITAVQGALDLQGVPSTTTPLSPSNFVYARIGTPNGTNTGLTQVQNVRAGAPGPLIVTFTTPANGIGELLKAGTPAGVSQTAMIPIGQSISPVDTTTGGVAFHTTAALGPTTVSATIPGFIATTQATRSITNMTPGISVGALTVGSGLQDNTSFTLGAPNHGNFNVTITSSNSAVLLSPNATTAGTNQITISVPDGVQTVGFYVQGLEGLTSTVSGTITVSATGFADGTASETIVQAALDLQGVPGTLPVGAADANIYARLGTPGAGNTSLTQVQAVRAGLPGGSISVDFSSSNVAAATLVNSAGGTGSPQTVQIAAGQSTTPTTVGAGGVSLRRVAAGNSSISVAGTNIITTGQGTRSVAVQ